MAKINVNKAGILRVDFEKCLQNVTEKKYSVRVLSKALEWGFTEEELFALARLHKAGKFREEIEELLTDCNFHTEVGNFKEGYYSNILRNTEFLKPFYFTFGSNEKFPFQHGYLIVRALDLHEACNYFMKMWPDRERSNTLNCAFYYTDKEWQEIPEFDKEDNCYGIYFVM